MEWSIGDDEKRYFSEIQINDNIVELSSLLSNQEIIPLPEMSLVKGPKPNSILINISGESRLAYVIKVQDSWWIHLDGRIHIVNRHEFGSAAITRTEGSLIAPMPGTIIEILVKDGQRVRQGQTLIVMEAMKMEHKIQAPMPGKISSLTHKVGQRVDMGTVLIEINE